MKQQGARVPGPVGNSRGRDPARGCGLAGRGSNAAIGSSNGQVPTGSPRGRGQAGGIRGQTTRGRGPAGSLRGQDAVTESTRERRQAGSLRGRSLKERGSYPAAGSLSGQGPAGRGASIQGRREEDIDISEPQAKRRQESEEPHSFSQGEFVAVMNPNDIRKPLIGGSQLCHWVEPV